jgi:hypothetical protein
MAHYFALEEHNNKKNLSIQIQLMWNTKCFFIPLISGATRNVSKGLKKPGAIPG